MLIHQIWKIILNSTALSKEEELNFLVGPVHIVILPNKLENNIWDNVKITLQTSKFESSFSSTLV